MFRIFRADRVVGDRAVSEEQGLLHDIIANPDDDTPRLVCADWLDDHGRRERARLVRLQCAIERFGPTDEDDWMGEWLRLVDEEVELLCAHEKAWLAELPRFPGLRWSVGRQNKDVSVLERGFASVLCADNWTALERHGEQALAAAPINRLVIKRLGPRSARKLRHWPLLSRIRALDLDSSGLGDHGLSELARSPYLGQLRRLEMNNCWLGWGIRTLAGADWLESLTHLELAANPIGASRGDALARIVRRCRLGELCLESCSDLEDGVLAMIASGATLPDTLNLNATGLTNRTARAIADSPGSAGLQALYLGWSQIGDAGARALVESPHLVRLCSLDLRNTRLSGRARRLLRQRFRQVFLDDNVPASDEP
jgi:uncharacterized protein (TIGR02996 family)